MPKYLTYLVSITITASIELLLVLSAYSQPSNVQNECLSNPTPNQSFDRSAFDRAIENANNANKCRQWSNLLQTISVDPNLIWNDKKQILMVSFQPDCNNGSKANVLSCNTKDDIYTVPQNSNGQYPLWVTVVPEIKAFIIRESYKKSFPKNNSLTDRMDFLTKRIKQFLGLEPENKYNTFVEIWVAVDDVTRPCIDKKDETDSSRTICSTWNNDEIGRNEELKSFKNALNSNYPFTGFGYTYDWGNPNTIVGTSEFVVRGGAKVKVRDNFKIMDYFLGSWTGLIPE